MQFLVSGFGELYIFFVGNIVLFVCFQYQVMNLVVVLGFIFVQGGCNILGLVENGVQYYCIFYCCVVFLVNIWGGVVFGIVEQCDVVVYQVVERFDIMDFNVVGSLWVEGGDQFLYWWCLVGKVVVEVSVQGVMIFCQICWQWYIKEKVELVGGDWYQ